MLYLYSVYKITTTSKRNFCHGKPGTCIMALRTYVLISLLLILDTQYIQYVSMVVQLRLSLARSSMPQKAN